MEAVTRLTRFWFRCSWEATSESSTSEFKLTQPKAR